jgi:signal peptidase I
MKRARAPDAGSLPILLMTSRGRHSPGRHITPPNLTTRFGAVSSVLPVFLIALALLVIVLPRATGYDWRTVVSGSMRPILQPGDVVLISSSMRPIEVGDVIAFSHPTLGSRDVVHRVTGIGEDGSLTTKGDANKTVDPWIVGPSEVIGREVLAIPKVGFLVQALTSKPGIVVSLVIPSLIIIIGEGRTWYRFVRYGPEVFETLNPGRHLPRRGRHLAEVSA